MTPWHVVSGISGAIMVLPRDGLKDGTGKPLHYDRVYYIGENDFYVTRDAKGKFKSYGSPEGYADMVEVMRKLIPTHVVFNGKVGALTGKNALAAKVGETVLIVHSQANRDTRPHLIGGHGDYVWETVKPMSALRTPCCIVSAVPPSNVMPLMTAGPGRPSALHCLCGQAAYIQRARSRLRRK